MPKIIEGAFTYEFPATWDAVKFDEMPFYRNHFQSFAGGSPAVDVVAFDRESNEVWLIEGKDYRAHRRIKASEWFDEMAEKIRGTLVCLLAARANAADAITKPFATSALRKPIIRCVLHLEQPSKPSKLFPQVFDPKTAKDKLRKALRAVDAHPIVGSQAQLNSKMIWQVL
jgi:hypothetical protein